MLRPLDEQDVRHARRVGCKADRDRGFGPVRGAEKRRAEVADLRHEVLVGIPGFHFFGFMRFAGVTAEDRCL